MEIESFILITIIILVILAIGDIIVGVSNDAVNFLNSAIGSKVASWNTIMIIASTGILLGSLSSAGMMEIARKGIINPEYFSLYEIVIIFVSVTITNVILLDFFNTIGIPTSSTISLVFELLGASFTLSIFKIIKKNEPLNFLLNINSPEKNYLNWDKTNEIILSIFFSVLIAFIMGAIIQYISRVLFTFNYIKRMKIIGIVWCTIAITCMSYYLIYKGLKSTYTDIEITQKEMLDYLKTNNFLNKSNNILKKKIIIKKNNKTTIYKLTYSKKKSKNLVYSTSFGNQSIKKIVHYINSHIFIIIIGFIIFWSLIFIVLHQFKINSLKIVVLFGTFCMAMAFAGNDLVNFIGIPITAIQSYDIFQYSAKYMDPLKFNMIDLKFPIQTPYIYLFFSGLLMITTLWISKKSKNVTETELKLSSQEEGDEKFKPNTLSKTIVKLSMIINQIIYKIIPHHIANSIESRFIPLNNVREEIHFDLVRASVNITVASILIAIGTDLQLPLSTTYVTFMVAMGTSLADRAWGRETAVYRITGVINVIGSWFITGIIAFLGGAITALIITNFEFYGLIFMIIFLIIIIIKNYINHQKKIKLQIQENNLIDELSFVKKEILEKYSSKISKGVNNLSIIYNLSINGILNENQNILKESTILLKELKNNFSNTRSNVIKILKKTKYINDKSSQIYLILNEIMTDNIRSLELLVKTSLNHIENSHKPLNIIQLKHIQSLYKDLELYLYKITNLISSNIFQNNFEEINKIKNLIYEKIEQGIDDQSQGISSKKYGFKNSTLMFSILLESKDIVSNCYRLLNSFKKINENNTPIINL